MTMRFTDCDNSGFYLRAALDHYRALGQRGPRQAQRLADLEAEQTRRQIEAGRQILTRDPNYRWDDQ